MIKKIPGAALVKINQKIGFRFITKFGEKGVINLGKTVPFVGGVVGGSFDAVSTSIVAKNAIKMFIENEDPDDTLPTADEIASIEEIYIENDENDLL